MIRATALNGRQVAINAELIKSAESTPDTIISMTNGQTMIVRESLDEIIRRVIEYQKEIRRPSVQEIGEAQEETDTTHKDD